MADTSFETPQEIFPTAATIAEGHTLRLSLQRADAPHLPPPTLEAAALATGVLSVHQDPARPSSVVLPIQPSPGLVQ